MAITNKNKLIYEAAPEIVNGLNNKNTKANTAPDIIPFAANSLKGIYGSNAGVKTAPAIIPMSMAGSKIIPRSIAFEKEKITLSRGAEILGYNLVEMRQISRDWAEKI